MDHNSDLFQMLRSLLEEILGKKLGDFVAEDGSNPGDNYMSVLYSISVHLDTSEDKRKSSEETYHYLLKCYPKHPARQAYLNKTNMFHNEFLFYTDWAKQLVHFQTESCHMSKDMLLLPAFPPCLGGKCINYRELPPVPPTDIPPEYSPFDNVILMTDLRKSEGYKMHKKMGDLGLAHIELAFKEYAKLHALSWAYATKTGTKAVEKFPCLNVSIPASDLEMWANIFASNVTKAVAAMDAVFGENSPMAEGTLKLVEHRNELCHYFIYQTEQFDKQVWKLHRNSPKDHVTADEKDAVWRIIGHGDAWCNNLLFQYDPETNLPQKVILVDFQLVREACPTSDLVNLIYTSTTTSFRRQHLANLLKLYHDEFTECCAILKVDVLPGFCELSLTRKFHRMKLLGYMMAIISLPMVCADVDQNEVNLEAHHDTKKLTDIFVEAFATGSAGSIYQRIMAEVAVEMYEQGVI